MPGGKLGDEALVGVRIVTAQPMIEVSNEENDAEFFAEFEQHAQQGDGVGSAGDRNGHAVARVEKATLSDVQQHLFAHATILFLRKQLRVGGNQPMKQVGPEGFDGVHLSDADTDLLRDFHLDGLRRQAGCACGREH